MEKVEGIMNAADLRFGIVVSRFNSMITDKLLEGALDILRRHGVSEDNIVLAKVPGSFEVPIAAKKLISTKSVDAVICLGCLIKGETVHFDYLAWEVTRGMDDVALATGIPVTNGVLTVETVEQAMNRAGIKFGNKGSAAAEAAIEMACLFRSMEQE